MFPARRRTSLLPFLLAAAPVAWLSAIFLLGSTSDEEEFRFAVLSASLRVRALADGDLGLWTPLLGLGLPQPFVPGFALHPLAPLLAWFTPVTWVRLVLVAHTLLGAFGTWQLGRSLGLSPLARALCVLTLLLAAPTQNYLFSDFWPSHFVMWTAMPWVLWAAWRVLDERERPQRRWAVALGLAVGLAIANTNPGYAISYTVLAVAVLAARWRLLHLAWARLLIAGTIAVALASPVIIQLAGERTFFAADLGLSNLPDPLPSSAWQDVFLRPWRSAVEGTRTLFFGGPLAVLAILGFRLARARPDLVAVVVVSAVLLFTDLIPATYLSARYHLRDPLTLCAVPLGALVLDRWLRGSSPLRALAYACVALQAAVVVGTAWPLLARTWQPDARAAVVWQGATGATPLVDALTNQTEKDGRFLFSPQVDHDVTERALVEDGLGINALAYRDRAVVNGSFKAVSADAIWPDDRLFYGRIRAPQPFVASAAALDVLGIRYVLAHRGEAGLDSLRQRAVFKTTRGAELVLHENADAWPGAFLVLQEFGDAALPLLPRCAHDRLLCRDLSLVTDHRDPRPVTVVREGAEIRVRWTAAPEPRILVVSEMFRPQWKARTGNRSLSTRVMYGALIGVPLPAGVGEVRLWYRNVPLEIATMIAYAALLVGAIVVLRPARRTAAAGLTGPPLSRQP